ncbi:DUF7619 domain-containing protein [Pseudobacter ginsenosidimutans]|uniref:Putative repeat protein (TIGR01451 family)/predicted secreted protein (Por secretion system target) n=1 Tax=Pseudobacter ginsenosidimutans TaxID=661488 RepID=A0A4Q7MSJ4_9BACT|nr:T9SS type A sorting domain-containing protein [Pseudobacter ginsenosidimutans]QEC41437.1 T9SS type A sorting domain-containing protein [Pseudobacter ginsenosidimutans]RZS71782.1 putative repeat protein (TIGR01451 family)/predicted secreted protein (Por secretion system target) [Pseudobacter ginsenosidimutans]
MRFKILLLIISCVGTLNAQLPYGIKWQKNYGGSNVDKAWDLLPLSDSGHLLIGHSFSNDGDVSGHHGSTNTADGWIFRLDANHNIIWQKSAGGSGNDYLTNVIKARDGNYVAIGNSTSGDDDLPGNFGGADIWAIKFDLNGSIIWSKHYGGSGQDSANTIIQLPSGEFMIAGSSKSLDGQVNATNTSAFSIWNFRITENGDFISGLVMGNIEGEYPNHGEDLKILPDGNIIMSVLPATTSVEGAEFPTGMLPTVWLVKLTPQGAVIWKKEADPGNLSRYEPLFCASIQTTTFGITLVESGDMGPMGHDNRAFLMSLLNFDGSNTGLKKFFFYGFDDAGLAGNQSVIVSNRGTVGLSDSSILAAGYYKKRFDASSDFYREDAFLARKNFSKTTPEPLPVFFGGSNEDAFAAVKRDVGSHFVAAGYSASSDGDLTGNHGAFDAWIVGLTDSVNIQKNYIKGRVFLDHNNNQAYDAGDQLFSQLKVKSSKTGLQIISIPYDGYFTNEVDTGNFVSSVMATPFYSVHPVSHNSAFGNYGNEDNVDFAVTLITGLRDYKVSLISLNLDLIPAYEVLYHAIVSNKGTDTMKNQMAVMVKDSRFELVMANPEPAYQSGDTLKWLINSLVPDSTFKAELIFYTAQPPILNLGDTVINSFEVDSMQDLTPFDNMVRLSEKVAPYLEDNGIIADFGESMPLSEYERGDYLSYTIHFQNTGSDTSFNVLILDTLNNKFDPQSLEMISASHPYQLSLVNNNVYQWKFSGIGLVDSGRNAQFSRGSVSFRVKPSPGLNIGSELTNSASIYFDDKLPVRTTHKITISASKPPIPQISGIHSSYCKNDGIKTASIENLSTAGGGTTAEVLINGAATSLAGNQFSFNPSTLNNGANTIKVSFSNSAGISSKEINLDIFVPVTPALDVSASAITVTEQSPAVTISVANPVHAGSDPLYTFAKDKSFTNIIQAYSVSTSITMQPSALTVGENKIYVKMESSETCYTDKYAIDSILIVKSTPTGIADPDFPASNINIGPNPFTSIINISGLQRSKSYLLTIVNASGTVLWKRKVSNTNTYIIQSNGFTTGVYWLHITDEKNKRPLGTMSLYHQQ